MSHSEFIDGDQPLNRAVAQAAAKWFTRLAAGDASDDEIRACLKWRLADPEHERAWQRAERISQKFSQIPSRIGMSTLNRPVRTDRRASLKMLAWLLASPPAAYLAWSQKGGAWMADYRTAAGQRRDVLLADGTRVHLNTATSLDVRFDEHMRLLVLREGEIWIETAPDRAAAAGILTAAKRPFLVHTAHGAIRALGTRFNVRDDARTSWGKGTEVVVQQGAVEVRPRQTNSLKTVVHAGQQQRFTSEMLGPVEAVEAREPAWIHGMLLADNMRLADFAAELARYRTGFVQCESSVADLRISGVFQLNRIDEVLAALPQTLPVEVIYRTRYWATIVPVQR